MLLRRARRAPHSHADLRILLKFHQVKSQVSEQSWCFLGRQKGISFICKKILTLTVKAVSDELKFRSIKVSSKGQITLPSDIQREIGIKKGDEILLIRKGGRIILEKPERFEKNLKDEFADTLYLSERSLRKLWQNKGDEVWNQYLKR